ncbi:SCO6880 family protein [Streptomyces sp. NBC_01197]|uniref:SCO6880 family protein n=1 Tax=Streptomyces sp. NBC_01197 TaxID=2903768 RepID=UPI002E1403DE
MAAAGEGAGPAAPRTYGNWRRPTTAGVISQLGFVTSLMLLGGVIVVVLCTLISYVLAIVIAVVLALVMTPLALKDRHGRTMLVRMTSRLAWRQTVKRGAHIYRSGPLGRTDQGSCQLPGLAASSDLSEAQDSYGRPFGLLTYPNSRHHVVVLTCDADGAALVDQDQVDIWVAYWGHWLSSLATEPGLVGASVTVESAPDSGLRLRGEVHSNLDPDAPQLAKDMLAEVLESYPASSAQISTRIALTYSGAARNGHPRRTVAEMAVDLGNRLPGLTEGLSMTGAGAARPLSAEELSEAVRIAYDPSVSTLVEESRSTGGSGLTWSDAGPAGAEEAWDHYRHETATSVTWMMSEAPRGEVLSSVLTGLLVPHPDIARKRVTLLYRPHDPSAAARIVEMDRKNARLKANQSHIAKAMDDIAVRSADQTAQEEAAGAGVVRFSMLVTATVADRAAGPRARAAVDNLAAPARIKLRVVTGSQAAAFAACLPIGLVLPLHLTIPSSVRDNL